MVVDYYRYIENIPYPYYWYINITENNVRSLNRKHRETYFERMVIVVYIEKAKRYRMFTRATVSILITLKIDNIYITNKRIQTKMNV